MLTSCVSLCVTGSKKNLDPLDLCAISSGGCWILLGTHLLSTLNPLGMDGGYPLAPKMMMFILYAVSAEQKFQHGGTTMLMLDGISVPAVVQRWTEEWRYDNATD